MRGASDGKNGSIQRVTHYFMQFRFEATEKKTKSTERENAREREEKKSANQENAFVFFHLCASISS